MEYSEKRGLKISKYTLGTVQLGVSYGIANKEGKPDPKKASQILDTAIAAGINSIDTSSDYGDAEQVIGNYFSSGKADPSQVVVTTKFHIPKKGPITPEEVEKHIRSSVRKSIDSLGIRKIPILLLHHAEDMYEFGKVVPETLKKLKKEGLVERVGVSVYNGREVEQMLEDDLYEATQVPMNIFDQRLIRGGIIRKLHERDIIVFVRSVFLQGLFFLKPEALRENLKDAEMPLRQLAALAENEGVTIGQMALSFIRDLEGVTSLVIGAETPEQVRENAKLMNAPRLSSATTDKILQSFRNIPNHVVNPFLWDKPELWKEYDAKQ